MIGRGAADTLEQFLGVLHDGVADVVGGAGVAGVGRAGEGAARHLRLGPEDGTGEAGLVVPLAAAGRVAPPGQGRTFYKTKN